MGPLLKAKLAMKSALPTLIEVLPEQARGAFCQEAAAFLGITSSCYLYYQDVNFVFTSLLDGAMKTVVLSSLCPRILDRFHCRKVAKHPSGPRSLDNPWHKNSPATTWPKPFRWYWATAKNAPEDGSASNRVATENLFHHRAPKIYLHGYIGPVPESCCKESVHHCHRLSMY